MGEEKEPLEFQHDYEATKNGFILTTKATASWLSAPKVLRTGVDWVVDITFTGMAGGIPQGNRMLEASAEDMIKRRLAYGDGGGQEG